jgi:hypothetical protein
MPHLSLIRPSLPFVSLVLLFPPSLDSLPLCDYVVFCFVLAVLSRTCVVTIFGLLWCIPRGQCQGMDMHRPALTCITIYEGKGNQSRFWYSVIYQYHIYFRCLAPYSDLFNLETFWSLASSPIESSSIGLPRSKYWGWSRIRILHYKLTQYQPRRREGTGLWEEETPRPMVWYDNLWICSND